MRKVLNPPFRIYTFVGLYLLTLVIFSGCMIISLLTSNDKPRKDMPDLIPAINAIDKATPIVKLYDKDSGAFFCSGTVIAQNYIVTAAHCLDGRSKTKPSIEVRNMLGQTPGVMGTAAFYEGRSDTGLIEGDFSAFNAMDFTTSPININLVLLSERVVAACGFPYGGEFYCVAIENRGQWEFGIRASGSLYPGMSGGPVIDVQSGYLVGVNTAVMEPGVYLSPIVELLNHAHVKIAGQ